MSETLSRPERIEKTPEERHAQAMRIASMLVERAMKMPTRRTNGSIEGAESVVDGSRLDASTAGLSGDSVWISEVNPGVGRDLLEVSVHSGGVHIDKTKKVKQTENGQNFKRLQVHDYGDSDKNRTSYIEIADGSMAKDVELTSAQADKAMAAALMEARGAIAAHEIAQKQATDKQVEAMF